jgi:hypothetical protein
LEKPVSFIFEVHQKALKGSGIWGFIVNLFWHLIGLAIKHRNAGKGLWDKHFVPTLQLPCIAIGHGVWNYPGPSFPCDGNYARLDFKDWAAGAIGRYSQVPSVADNLYHFYEALRPPPVGSRPPDCVDAQVAPNRCADLPIFAIAGEYGHAAPFPIGSAPVEGVAKGRHDQAPMPKREYNSLVCVNKGLDCFNANGAAPKGVLQDFPRDRSEPSGKAVFEPNGNGISKRPSPPNNLDALLRGLHRVTMAHLVPIAAERRICRSDARALIAWAALGMSPMDNSLVEKQQACSFSLR